MKSFVRYWHNNRLWIVASWLCVGWEVMNWIGMLGMTPLLHMEEAAAILLTLMMPFWPVPVGIVMLVLGVVFTYLPIPSMGSYFLDSPLGLFAALMLGKAVGNWRIPAILLVVLESICVASQVVDDGYFAGYIWVYLPLVLAWGVGALIQCNGVAEQEKACAEQQAEERRRQLDTVHVLHDSIANTMSYALMRCRVAEDGTSPTALCEAESALELALRQLRSEVITPMRQQIEQSSGPATASHSFPSSSSGTPPIAAHDGELAVRVAINNIAQRLDRFGFTGAPTYSDSNGSELSEPMTRMLCQIVEEIGANIMKHGVPGDYALAVTIRGNDGVTIVSSNQCADKETPDDVLIEHTGHGLRLLRDTVALCDGTVQTYVEDGEWVVSVRITSLR